jgi:hypothetical protein
VAGAADRSGCGQGATFYRTLSLGSCDQGVTWTTNVGAAGGDELECYYSPGGSPIGSFACANGPDDAGRDCTFGGLAVDRSAWHDCDAYGASGNVLCELQGEGAGGAPGTNATDPCPVDLSHAAASLASPPACTSVISLVALASCGPIHAWTRFSADVEASSAECLYSTDGALVGSTHCKEGWCPFSGPHPDASSCTTVNVTACR